MRGFLETLKCFTDTPTGHRFVTVGEAQVSTVSHKPSDRPGSPLQNLWEAASGLRRLKKLLTHQMASWVSGAILGGLVVVSEYLVQSLCPWLRDKQIIQTLQCLLGVVVPV